jgi:protein-disulfide isomerase
VCAQDQGKFWEMHDLMFAEQASLDVKALKDKARRIGLDTSQFDQCLDGGKAADAVARDVNEAEKLGISGTPASFVNGRFVDGAVSVDDLSALIEDELQRKTRPAS